MDASVVLFVVRMMTSLSEEEKGRRSGVGPEGSAEMDVGRRESRRLRRGVVLVVMMLVDGADLCGCMVRAIEVVGRAASSLVA